MDRTALLGWYQRNRARTRALFDMIDPAAYYTRPIALRNPIVFYEGHLPAFNVIAFIRRGLGRAGVDERLEQLFARGIDPDSEASAVPRSGADMSWPAREEVIEYGRRADALIVEALQNAPLADEERPVMRDGQAIFTALEHEAMHQETLLYMWHQLPYDAKRPPGDYRVVTGGAPPPPFRISIPAGRARLGAHRHEIPFGWDNEFPARDGQWCWHGMFEEIPLPPAWPVYVTKAEAESYARWRGGRLMTEPEFHRAAYVSADGEGPRAQPWGPAPANATRGNFDFLSHDPRPVGSFPQGASGLGVHDLVGNGWEWTSSRFGPFAGFAPMAAYPEYAADFFDGQHFVLKGASAVTARELVRPSFRNWFRPDYPFVNATFRCVYEDGQSA